MRPDPSVDLADVLTSVVFVGVGLTSLTLALWPSTATRFDEAANELVASADGPAPEEILVAGVALEDLVIHDQLRVDGLDGVPLRLVDDADEVRLVGDRYWVVSRTSRQPEAPDGFGVEVLETDGELALSLWQRQGAEPVVRLSDRMRTASARYRTDDTVTVCSSWRFGRLMCGPNEWNYVGVTEVPIQGRPSLCIWAHPLTGRDLEVTFSDVPMRGQLRGRYAMADSALSDLNASPVDFRVLVDGQERVKRVTPNRAGWNHFQLEGDGEPHDLTFVVSATNDGRRHFCFDGELVATDAGSTPPGPRSRRPSP